MNGRNLSKLGRDRFAELAGLKLTSKLSSWVKFV